MAAVGVLLAAVGIGVLVGGESDRHRASPRLPAPPRGGAEATYKEIGVKLSGPPGWSLSRGGRALVFRSRDRAAVLSIYSPPRESTTTAVTVLQSALRAIRRSYTDVSARPGDGRRVAGLPTSGVVVSARNRRGARVRALVTAAQGRRRAWVVQVFATAGSSTARLVEAQVALESLRLDG